MWVNRLVIIHGPITKRTQLVFDARLHRSGATIDSRASHTFFYDRDLLTNYEKMEHEEVEGPATKSTVLGYGPVEVPLPGGKMVAAYHVPDFTTVSSLTDLVDITFSRNFKYCKGCFMFEPGTKNIVFETVVRDGLYRMTLQNFRAMSASKVPTDKEISESKQRHAKTGHISTDRYITLKEQDPSIKKF